LVIPYDDYKTVKNLKGDYRVYGIEAARLLFGLESGTGEPNA
jgi:hypothetical protein